MDKEKEVYQDRRNKSLSSEVLSACESLLYKATGLHPYQEQREAAKLIYKGNIVDIKTGEGKTLSILYAALLLLREGRKVYIVTSNDYLSERDYRYSKNLIESLGFQSAFLKGEIGGTQRAYQESNLIYATGETLIFDYLRGVPADYDFVIIDEVDYILVESANHDFSVSSQTDLVRFPKSVFTMARRIAEVFTYQKKTAYTKKEDYLFDYQYESDVVLDMTSRSAEITERGFSKLQGFFHQDKTDLFFMEVLQATLLARYFFIKDVHYLVQEEKIIIINENNGRMSLGGSHDIILQTALEEKEDLPLTPKALLHNTCSFPVFFSLFRTLTGVSGTAALVPYDFPIIFHKDVKKVKPHRASQRIENYEYFDSDLTRKMYISRLIERKPGPFLVVTDSDRRSQEIYSLLQGSTKQILLLDNQHLDKEEIYLQEVQAKDVVLISSKIVGRGTDIVLPEVLKEGLTVILSIRFLSERAERQVLGRTGRNGRKGTCYILTAPEDSIFDYADKKKYLTDESYVQKLQQSYEARQFEQRKHIYIRSKLFFDQDRAIIQRLKSLQSFEECRAIAEENKDHSSENVSDAFRMIQEENIAFLPIHQQMLLQYYEQIRPYYQQQFLRYNDLMAATLYNTDGFHERGKEYVNSSYEILHDVIGKLAITVARASVEEKEESIQ